MTAGSMAELPTRDSQSRRQVLIQRPSNAVGFANRLITSDPVSSRKRQVRRQRVGGCCMPETLRIGLSGRNFEVVSARVAAQLVRGLMVVLAERRSWNGRTRVSCGGAE